MRYTVYLRTALQRWHVLLNQFESLQYWRFVLAGRTGSTHARGRCATQQQPQQPAAMTRGRQSSCQLLPEQVSPWIPTDGRPAGRAELNKERLRSLLAAAAGRQTGRQVRGWLAGRQLRSYRLPADTSRGCCTAATVHCSGWRAVGWGSSVQRVSAISGRTDDKQTDLAWHTCWLGYLGYWLPTYPMAGGEWSCLSLHQVSRRSTAAALIVVRIRDADGDSQ